MRNSRKFTDFVNWGALVLLVAAVVALLCTQRLPQEKGRDLASKDVPTPAPSSPR